MLLLVEAVPTKAKVTTSTSLSVATPAAFNVNRRGRLVVKIENSGYEPVNVQVSSRSSPRMIGKAADTVSFNGDGISAGAPS